MKEDDLLQEDTDELTEEERKQIDGAIKASRLWTYLFAASALALLVMLTVSAIFIKNASTGIKALFIVLCVVLMAVMITFAIIARKKMNDAMKSIDGNMKEAADDSTASEPAVSEDNAGELAPETKRETNAPKDDAGNSVSDDKESKE